MQNQDINQRRAHTRQILNKNIDFIIFDLDGVLVDTISSWVYIHEHFGVNNDPAYFTYMRSEIDDFEFMRRDIRLWLDIKKEFHISEIQKILDTIPLMPNFNKTMDVLNSLGIDSAIVSAGLDLLGNRVAELGGIKHVLANGLETDKNGFLTGEGILRVKLRDKGEVVKNLISSLDLKKSSVVSIGNGKIDVPMFKESGLGIAFNPNDQVIIQNADIIIEKKDLAQILKYIC